MKKKEWLNKAVQVAISANFKTKGKAIMANNSSHPVTTCLFKSIRQVALVLQQGTRSFYNSWKQPQNFIITKHILITGGLIGFTIGSVVFFNRYAGIIISDWTTATTRFPCNEEYSLDLETKVYLSEIENLTADKSKLSKICFAPLEIIVVNRKLIRIVVNRKLDLESEFLNKKIDRTINNIYRLNYAIKNFNQNTQQNVKKQRILVQLKEVKVGSVESFKVLKFFQINYYIAISIQIGSTIIAATSLFFILKTGWKDANRYIINVLFVATAIISVSNLVPTVFKHESHIQNSYAALSSYVSLERRIYSYLTTNRFALNPSIEVVSTSKTNNLKTSNYLVNIDDVISYIDKELDNIKLFKIEFDSTQVPNYQKVYDNLVPPD